MSAIVRNIIIIWISFFLNSSFSVYRWKMACFIFYPNFLLITTVKFLNTGTDRSSQISIQINIFIKVSPLLQITNIRNIYIS